jgi:hypothetical protein
MMSSFLSENFVGISLNIGITTLLCVKGDYIFVIDADEIPQEKLIKNIKGVIEETKADLIYVPRINICPGYTERWLEKHNFNVNENGWINWPDFQGRVYKNNGVLKWTKGLHETVTGSEKTIGLQANPNLAIVAHQKCGETGAAGYFLQDISLKSNYVYLIVCLNITDRRYKINLF